MARGRHALVISTLVLVASGCGARAPDASTETKAEAAPVFARLEPIGDVREGSAIALAKIDGRKVAVIADEDERAVLVVGLQDGELVASFAAKARPAAVLVERGTIFVSLRDARAVVALRFDAKGVLHEVARATTAAEPIGLARSPNGASLLVACATGSELVVLDAPMLTGRAAIELAPDPRGVTSSDDGQFAFVVHGKGSIVSRVALDPRHQVVPIRFDTNDFVVDPRADGEAPLRRRRALTQAGPIAHVRGEMLAPATVAHPTSDEPTSGYGPSGGFAPEEPAILELSDVTVDGEIRTAGEVTAATIARVSHRDETRRPHDCLLPSAIAIDVEKGVVVTACLGDDRVIARTAAPRPLDETFSWTWSVPSGPVALAVDPDTHRAFVWSRFARKISAILIGDHLPSSTVVATIQDHADPSPGNRRGRELFYATSDERISRDGRACASCHPGGREDGLAWSFGDSVRRTPALAGRLVGTAPYGWFGETKTVEAHLGETLKRLGGTGLEDDDRDALARYATEIEEGPARRGATDPRAIRGRAIFDDERVGCATCHTKSGRGVDGARHEVGSGGAFDTPSLIGVGSRAPYFHDGRFPTLGDALRQTRGKMGFSEHLGDAEIDDLVAYLETL